MIYTTEITTLTRNRFDMGWFDRRQTGYDGQSITGHKLHSVSHIIHHIRIVAFIIIVMETTVHMLLN